MTDSFTKKYGFMPRVTILCHSKEKLGFYIYIYIYDALNVRTNTTCTYKANL
jgi:hypothetical protein